MLSTVYTKIYTETWNIFKQVPVKDEPYNDLEIPLNSMYIKRASPDSRTYSVDINNDEKTITAIVFTSGVFSNWFPCIIKYMDKVFYSTEQLFMYIKATNLKYHKDDSKEVIENNELIAKQILMCRCPKELQKFGRMLLINIDAWNEDSAEHLKNCIILKFTQNSYLKEFLDIIYNNKYIIVEGKADQNYGCGLDFDPSNPEHLNSKNWTGKMKLTSIYNDAMNEIYK
jgi:ribA/ribD-fused uncharacterized protein